MTADNDPKNIVGSIIKGARLLDLYSTDRREITLNEFTQDAGFNKTTTHRLLQTLVAAGWLVRSPSGGYRLGARMLVLGAIARADLDLRNEALPFMRQLADELGDTAFLMVPGPQGAVVVETTVGDNPVQVHGLAVGSVLPFHVAAGPVVLAAFSPETRALALGVDRTRFTEHTTCDAEDLAQRFDAVQESGYSVSMEDYIEGVCAVAAPVMGADGNILASLSVGGPTNRFREGLRERTIELVIELAKTLSTRL